MTSMGVTKTKQKFYMFGISFDIEDTSSIDDKTRYVNILFYRQWIREIASGMPWYNTKGLFWNRDQSLSYYRSSNVEILIPNNIFVISFVILYYIVDLTLLISK